MRAVHYRFEHGSQLALMGLPGRKFTKLVVIDYPVRIRKVTNQEAEKFARDMDDWTPARLAKGMRNTGRRFGITKSALALLREGMAFRVPTDEPTTTARLTPRKLPRPKLARRRSVT